MEINALELSTDELAFFLSPDSPIRKELLRRNVIRSKNIVGDLGEYYAKTIYDESNTLPNLMMAAPGVKNIDLLSREGERYSVKTVSSRNGTTGSFWDPESIENNEKKFEYLLIVILNSRFSVDIILELTWDDFIKHKKFNKRMNNYNISVTQALIADVNVPYSS
jgi:hypothetical protein